MQGNEKEYIKAAEAVEKAIYEASLAAKASSQKAEEEQSKIEGLKKVEQAFLDAANSYKTMKDNNMARVPTVEALKGSF